MIFPILRYPDKRLRIIAKPVVVFNKATQTLVKDMFATMYAKDGIGLAATQVNQHLQVVVMDVPDLDNDYQLLLKKRKNNRQKPPEKRHPLCFINPNIIEQEGREIHVEGCLSVPGFSAEVERFNHIKIEALNEKGDGFTLEATGLLAICIQHELDHLNGILFVDHLSKLKQKRLLERIKKTNKP